MVRAALDAHPRSKGNHGDALAAALGVPDNADLLAASGARRGDRLTDGQTYRMELVVASNLLDDAAFIFKQHKVTQVVQQVLRGEHTTHQGLKLIELTQRVKRDAVNGAPGHKALRVGAQATEQRLGAIRDHQQLVGVEHIWNLRLVGLNLIKRLPDIGVHNGWVLQLDQHQRQVVPSPEVDCFARSSTIANLVVLIG